MVIAVMLYYPLGTPYTHPHDSDIEWLSLLNSWRNGASLSVSRDYGIVSSSLDGYNRECTNLGHEIYTMPSSESGSGSSRRTVVLATHAGKTPITWKYYV